MLHAQFVICVVRSDLIHAQEPARESYCICVMMLAGSCCVAGYLSFSPPTAGSTRTIASSGRQKNRTGIVDIPIPRLTYICEVGSPYQPER